ncbi:glycosyltransferase family 39 protein [Streptomyces sp. NEAU-sy36]|uniref:glycosyltransferase family 39 protein n=1 Tax=unclassified Streptomyces TaxID=2593676 RepID=UPI0015D626C4|nr:MULTISPECIES: glycosyltransferase family 39 protein [unclassified Streptomyces]QLJ03365.1 glycosyltransferase family 39 protein [Streptomyces sp. NEAU-sy36]
MATNVLDATAPTGAGRRTPWKTPAGEPAYARPALLVLTALAALLYSWDIGHSQYHTFYADAARSMTQSWKAFFYGSFDPGNSITLDKTPGFLWPQALCARLLGFHPWTLTLPQVLEGVASLLVLYRLVHRWAGTHAALVAGAAFLVTPAAVGLFRTSVEDPAFTLCLLLAAEATQRAARSGRPGPLLRAGFWVGAAFQAKMLEAWAVLPALALVHLVSAPVALRRRLAHLGLAALVTVAVSASWMLAVTLVPAKERPYVDGTTDNSAFSMVVGYNFLNRFGSLGVSAAATGSVSATQGSGHRAGAGRGTGGPGAAVPDATGHLGARHGTGATGAAGPAHRGAGDRGAAGPGGAAPRGGGDFGGARDGWAKMFGPALAAQTGWLYPFAAVAAGCGVLWRRGRPRTDAARAGFLLWGTWLATYFLVFSAGSVGPHTYYMGVIAVPLAALTGAGAVRLWRAHRAGGRRAWALPGAVAATTAWSAYLAGRFPAFLPWLAPAVAVLGSAATVLLVLTRPGRPRAGGRLALGGPAAALAALLAAPTAWAVQVFDPAYGTAGMGSVGPTAPDRGTAHTGTPGAQAARGHTPASAGPGAWGGIASDGGMTPAQRRLLDYTRAHRGSARYVFATTNWNAASPYILATGAEVLPLGGFSGRVPFPTPARFRRLVAEGRVRYVLAGGSAGFGPAAAGTANATAGKTAATRISDWVASSCAEVPAAAYGGTAAAPGQTLYRCDVGQ